MKPSYRILWSIVAAAIICQLLFLGISSRLEKFQNHTTEKLTELFEKDTDFDVLFLGSSKTHANIHPGVIDSLCGTNSYNAGIDGISLFEYKIILEAYLVNHPPPDFLCISLDLHSFHGGRNLFNPTLYLPYTSNKIIDTTLTGAGFPILLSRFFPFLNLPFYTDDDKVVSVIKSFRGKNEVPAGEFQYKGYLSNSDIVMDERTTIEESQEFTPQGRVLFDEILNICRKHSVRPVLIYSPEYQQGIIKHTRNAGRILDSIYHIASARKIPFFRNDTLSFCNETRYFRNTGHLNKKGALVYSVILAGQLQQLGWKGNNASADH